MYKLVDGNLVEMSQEDIQSENELDKINKEQMQKPHDKSDSERITELEEALDLLLSGETGVAK